MRFIMSLMLEKKKSAMCERGKWLFDNNQYTAEIGVQPFFVMQEKKESLVSNTEFKSPFPRYYSSSRFPLEKVSGNISSDQCVLLILLLPLLHHRQKLLIYELDCLRGIVFICLNIYVSCGSNYLPLNTQLYCLVETSTPFHRTHIIKTTWRTIKSELRKKNEVFKHCVIEPKEHVLDGSRVVWVRLMDNINFFIRIKQIISFWLSQGYTIRVLHLTGEIKTLSNLRRAWHPTVIPNPNFEWSWLWR